MPARSMGFDHRADTTSISVALLSIVLFPWIFSYTGMEKVGKRGPRPHGFAIEPRLLVTMREGCFFEGHPMEQSEAARLVGVSRHTWCLWENGRRGMHVNYARRWLEISAPYRIWEPLMTEQPQERIVASVRFKHVDVPTGPDQLDVRAPLTQEPIGPAPSDPLDIPDASELERISSESVSE